jgi:prepilin-type N-terminal cleavage/methylation domain-containing protein
MEKGFTIIELVISIAILSVGLVGIFGAFSVVAILTSDVEKNLVASYLSQEGMEIVRNIRETNWLNMDNCDGESCDYTWVDGLTTGSINYSINCTGGCQADYKAKGSGSGNSLNVYTGSGNYLNIDENGFYSYDSYGVLTSSGFKRKIFITCLPSGDCNLDHIIKVRTEVSWDKKANILLNAGAQAGTCGAYNCIATEGVLYNWYNYVKQQ